MPYPTQSMGAWILSQLRRWGYIKADVDFKKLSDEIFLSAETEKRMKEMASLNAELKWQDIPETKYPVYDVFGKAFDPGKVRDYITSFDIKRV